MLVCDFDPQANTTSGFGVDKTTSPNIYDVLLNGTETAKAISSTSYGDVLPSNKALAGATIEMIALEQREYRLKNALEQVAEHYDYIFIDCPPSLELLTLNALCAADTVLVPVQCEYYALEGLSDLLSTIRIVKPIPSTPKNCPGGGGTHHVRRPYQSLHAGGGGGQTPLPRPGVRHGDPP